MIEDTPECRARFSSLKDEEWRDFLAYWAKSPDEKFAIGRAMRMRAVQTAKGVYIEIPTCRVCKRTSVLDPCRRCAKGNSYPPPPGEEIVQLRVRHAEKPPSKAIVESLHAWAAEHRPDLRSE